MLQLGNELLYAECSSTSPFYLYVKRIVTSSDRVARDLLLKNRHILKRVKNNHCSFKRRINMTQQPNEQNNNNELTPQIEKLLIDNDSMNFPFHAAYLVYEEAFDKATEVQAKTELNQNIQDLKENKIDLETFYRKFSAF